MAGIDSRDPELEGSFSFSSCHDFNSSLTFFSDNSDSDETDSESCIEIALQSTPALQNHDHGDYCPKEIDLRISFSSTLLPFSELCIKPKCLDHDFVTTSMYASSSSFSTLSSSSSETQRDTQVRFNPSNHKIQKVINRSLHFPTLNSFLNKLMPKIKVSKEMDHENDRPCPSDFNHLELVRNSPSKSSGITALNTGIMMKLIIKFRTLNVRTLVALFMKPCQASRSTGSYEGRRHGENSGRGGTYQRLMRPFDKWLLQSNKAFGSGERSRATEMKLVSFRGVLGLSRKDGKTRSCTSSIKSSPIHHGLPRENSVMHAAENPIQAAIAHCKRSGGPNAV